MRHIFLSALFRQRNFAVGITHTKTEIVQAAILGLLLVGDQMSFVGYAAITLSMAGVMVLSATDGKSNLLGILTGLFTKASVFGILSGFDWPFLCLFVQLHLN